MALVFSYHLLVPLLLLAWTILAYTSRDPASIHFSFSLMFRSYRWLIGHILYIQYRPAKPPKEPTLFPKDITCVIITVYDKRDFAADLAKNIKTSFQNLPYEIIVVTDCETTAKYIETIKSEVLDKLVDKESFDRSSVKFQIKVSGVSNKRRQLAIGFMAATTPLILSSDACVSFPRNFLLSTLCVFEDSSVGICGTKKVVRRSALESTSPWSQYCERFWNVLGSTYIAQNDYRARYTNVADGGVNVVSGRALLVRTEIVRDKKFINAFLNERFLFKQLGPVGPDDDNFLTRWVKNHKWAIKIQDTDGAAVEITLGQQERYIGQCVRWARSTYRSNLCSLLTDRTVWRRYPWTVWLGLVPGLINLAFFWDLWILYIFKQSEWYTSYRMFYLYSLIYFAKSIKLMEHFRRHPSDFFFYFFPIPAYHIFAWFHSFIKLYAAITFYNTGWTGRKLHNPGETDFAFVFDYDGVLSNGQNPIQGAQETIKMLQRENIPFIILTNSGGKTENARAVDISKHLGVTISPNQIVQSHSPYRSLVSEYRDDNIIVIGGANDDIRKVAEHYGFEKVFTTSDLLLASGTTHPFPEYTREEHQKLAQAPKVALLKNQVKIAAVLVFSSPRDWCLDIQVLKDYLSKKDPPALYFCNPDLVWVTEHKEPRVAQGAFLAALKGVWQATTKRRLELKFIMFGKPTQKTFEFGEKTLQNYSKQLNEATGTRNCIKTVYMIGDNPESDVKGANEYRSPYKTMWRSVLVRTGVYTAGVPAYRPKEISGSCEEAVEWALRKEGYVIDKHWTSPQTGSVRGLT